MTDKVTDEMIDEALVDYITELEEANKWQAESIKILTTGEMPPKFDLQQMRFKRQYDEYQALKAKDSMLSK